MKKMIFFLFIVSILSIASCSHHQKEKNAKKPEHQKQTEKSVDPIQQKLNQMTLDEKISQMIIAGMTGTTLNQPVKTLINDKKIGGIILYGNNIQTTKQTRRLLNTLKKENADNPLPLFLSVDQEGGHVSRLPDDWTKFPTNEVIGNVNNPAFSYKIGALIGKELKAFGFNMDFAPVLDINSNPNNPVIGDRSFGASPEIVSSLGIQTMKGIRSQQIIPVVKHFPGHGDTSVDSHINLPEVDFDLDHLRHFELVPFQKAIQNGVDMIMVAHILFPEIGARYPASMSKKIITDLLRQDLHFQGVVITDDMTMGAIVKHYGLGKAAIRSISAGSNLILIAHGDKNVTTVLQALKNAVQDGTLPKQRINDSVYKIIQLKQKYGLSNQAEGPIDVHSLNTTARSLLHQYMP